MLLGVFGDLRHGLDRLHGVFASGGFSGKHDAGGAVVNGVGHVRDLRTGGSGILDHGFQHFRGGDDPLAQHPAHSGQLFLHGWHFHIGDFHTQVAPGDHNAAADGADFLHIVHAGTVLDLRHDFNVAAAVFVQQLADVQNVLLRGDEGRGHIVHAVGDAEQNIRSVLLGNVGAGHDLVGEGHALAVAERAACQTFAVDFGALNAFHFKPDDAVVHRYSVAGLQVLVEILIIDADLRLVPCHVLRGKGEAVPRFHFHLTGSKCSDAVLRAFGVQHDGDGQPQLLTYPLDQLDFPLVFGMGAVGKVQPRNIHAGKAHLGQRFLVFTGGADGTDDFCFAHKQSSCYGGAATSFGTP